MAELLANRRSKAAKVYSSVNTKILQQIKAYFLFYKIISIYSIMDKV
jgi:hypothetical protein